MPGSLIHCSTFLEFWANDIIKIILLNYDELYLSCSTVKHVNLEKTTFVQILCIFVS